MAISAAQKKASAKWDKENMITLGCKVYRHEAEAFKEYARKQNKTANTILKEFVQQCTKEIFESKKEDNNE